MLGFGGDGPTRYVVIRNVRGVVDMFVLGEPLHRKSAVSLRFGRPSI